MDESQAFLACGPSQLHQENDAIPGRWITKYSLLCSDVRKDRLGYCGELSFTLKDLAPGVTWFRGVRAC